MSTTKRTRVAASARTGTMTAISFACFRAGMCFIKVWGFEGVSGRLCGRLASEEVDVSILQIQPDGVETNIICLYQTPPCGIQLIDNRCYIALLFDEHFVRYALAALNNLTLVTQEGRKELQQLVPVQAENGFDVVRLVRIRNKNLHISAIKDNPP